MEEGGGGATCWCGNGEVSSGVPAARLQLLLPPGRQCRQPRPGLRRRSSSGQLRRDRPGKVAGSPAQAPFPQVRHQGGMSDLCVLLKDKGRRDPCARRRKEGLPGWDCMLHQVMHTPADAPPPAQRRQPPTCFSRCCCTSGGGGGGGDCSGGSPRSSICCRSSSRPCLCRGDPSPSPTPSPSLPPPPRVCSGAARRSCLCGSLAASPARQTPPQFCYRC